MSFKKNLSQFLPEHIRNFSIIAHIDHGKSTLSDRLLEYTGTLSGRTINAQFLDKLQVEKERGITVKAQSATMVYEKDGVSYLLNLIDTPGHVDFSYEVSRSLYACQGAILLVDASQGVEAQTIANFYLALGQDLVIIPVINKIDLPTAQPERVGEEMSQVFDFKKHEMVLASAKSGIGIDDILNHIIKHIPSPKADRAQPLKAMLFDSWYDEYKGVICLIALQNGHIKKNDRITLAQTGQHYDVLELGIMYPNETATEELFAGQVGYVITGMKSVKEAQVGDTIFHYKQPVKAFPGFKPAKPMVFAGIYPTDNSEFEPLRTAIAKLTINDASVTVEKKSSTALGLGFRCGFLGLLHMEVFKQRLEQEYNIFAIVTAPSVLYKIKLKNKESQINIESPSEFPDPNTIEEIYEPIITATIIVPQEYLGPVLKLCQEKRGYQKDISFLAEGRALITYILPLNEIATDFYDQLKSLSSGYASFDYEEAGYRTADLVKLDILLNGKSIDALSVIVHRDNAYYVGKDIVERLKKVIAKQMFEVIIQAAIGSKILARETISPLRKNVTAKCYGGDITRKRKLWEKQKEGKKKMKQLGSVQVPHEAFLTILKKV